MNKKILIISNQIGSTNYVLPILKSLKYKSNITLFMKRNFQPKNFKSHNILIIRNKSLLTNKFISNFDRIISSATKNNFEKYIIFKANKLGVETIQFIDFYGNIKERFFNYKTNRFVFPKKIIVNSSEDKKILLKYNCKSKIITSNNPYFNFFLNKSLLQSNYNQFNKKDILITTQPISNFYEYKFNEHTFVLDILKICSYYDNDIKIVYIKIHPDEKLNKYSQYLKKYPNLKVIIISEYTKRLNDPIHITMFSTEIINSIINNIFCITYYKNKIDSSLLKFLKKNTIFCKTSSNFKINFIKALKNKLKPKKIKFNNSSDKIINIFCS